MNRQSFTQKKLRIFIFVVTIVVILAYLQVYMIIPNRLMLLENEEYVYDINAPIKLDVTVDKSGVLSLNGEIIKDSYKVNLNSPLVIKSQKEGKLNLGLKLFGIIPFRTLSVDVIPKMNVIPCGNTIGVKLYTDGILVVGTSEFNGENGEKHAPWKESGIIEGDTIESIDNIKIKDIAHLTRIIKESEGKELEVNIKRDGKLISTKIKPQKSKEEQVYKIGLWVRDSTAGIGTLTFYDPDSKYFGALGHGITDVDTGKLLTVGKGEILKSSIVSIRKGEKGNPGELKGVFMQEEGNMGKIIDNTDYGIFGQLNKPIDNQLMSMPIGLRTEVKEGPAHILSNVKGEKVDIYNIEIQKVMTQNIEKGKGMIIKITDPRLLDITGGIVQGMSGSPIIQNGKIIGAVTHVFVNEPSKGYGIFIEWMLKGVAESSVKMSS